MIPGTPFIYYRGTRARNIGLTGPAYFGSGIVGRITPLSNGRLQAAILDYVEFEKAIDFRGSDGSFLEPSAKNSLYFQRGIRLIDDAAFAHILELAEVESRTVAETEGDGDLPGFARFNSEARLVEEYAVEIVKTRLIEQYGPGAVKEMPRNHPGYDILVRRTNAPDLHVEVKGTRYRSPVFFLTEGERVHSIEYSHSYQLNVVYAINLAERLHETVKYEGEIEDSRFKLAPILWQVRAGLADDNTTE